MRVAPCVLTVVLGSGLAAAQSVDVVLNGRVRDERGGVLPGATLTVTHPGTRLARSTTTDDAGYYSLPPIPAGSYDVQAERAGFATQVRRDQAFSVGTSITLDFVLRVAPVPETVEVRAQAPLLETSKNTLSRLTRQGEIDALPVANRSFAELAALAPGVIVTGLSSGVDISGSRHWQNAYIVDGVSAEQHILGIQRVAYAQDWVQEFQVLTSQYRAEFGQASGGVLNAITRSGSNRWGGRAYGFFRDEAWDAAPVLAASKPPLDEKRLGGTVGGPVLRDRLFVFGGFEWLRSESSRIVASAFPSANGTFPFDNEQNLVLAKADYAPRRSSTFRLRYDGQRSETDGVGIGGINTEEYGRATTVTADDVAGSWTEVLSSRSFSEARVAWSGFETSDTCNFAERNPPGTWFSRQYPGARFGCPVNFGTLREGQLQLLENVSWVRGRHELKAGGLATRTSVSGDFRNYRDGAYYFDRDVLFDPDNPASWPVGFSITEGPTAFEVASWSWGLFAQDAWRVSDDLTLNLGVRYDRDGSFTALNPWVRVDRGFEPLQEDGDNVAPRAGFAWTPFGDDRKTLVRGGAGLYYDQSHNNLAAVLFLNNVLVERNVTIYATLPGYNPFWPDTARVRRLLSEALAANTIPGVSSLPGILSGTTSLDPDLEVPGTVQASLGVARDFGRGLQVSADLVYAHGFDQLVARNVNWERNAALDEGRIVRLNPLYTTVMSLGNGGSFDYRALQVQADWAPSARHMAKVAYTLARSEGNAVSTLSGGAATNPFDYDEDWGPSANDVRHKLSVSGFTTLPLGFQLSTIVTYRSPLPYSATSVRQLDIDPFADLPEPPNARRGDDYFSLDARLAWVVRLGGRRSLTALVEGFNLTNTTNFATYVGELDSRLFGTPVTAYPKRRIQLGFRLDL